MKKISFFLMMLLLLTFSHCKKEKTSTLKSSEVILVKDQAAFNAAASDRSSSVSDPFELKNISYTGDSVEVTVAYSGGCEQHSFEIIWNEGVTSTNPPEIDLIIKHNANSDACEAYITETLSFALTDLGESVIYPDISLNVLNGGDPADSVIYNGNETEIRFAESDTCNTFVTARNAICGWGLYGNLWFALDDSISAGIPEYYFHKYLQPVAISDNIKGFVPVQGKRYKIGGKIDHGNYFPDILMCMAYAGPSLPIKILCIKEIN
jgi:hypothetical protein